jgi:hypothetical protein
MEAATFRVENEYKWQMAEWGWGGLVTQVDVAARARRRASYEGLKLNDEICDATAAASELIVEIVR